MFVGGGRLWSEMSEFCVRVGRDVRGVSERCEMRGVSEIF